MQMTFPINTSIPELHPFMKEEPGLNWTLARRVKGFGDAYMPVFKKVIREDEMWFLPKEELDARPDWEEVAFQDSWNEYDK